MKKKLVVLTLIFVSFVWVTASIIPNAYGEEPIVLRAGGAWPETSLFTPRFFTLFDIVKKRSNGRLQMKWIGGPEFINARDLPSAAARGVIDVFQTSPGYMTGAVPEGDILDAYPVHRSFKTEPDIFSEGMKILSPIYEKKLKIKLLSRVTYYPFYLWTKKQITSTQELKGLKIRAHGGYIPYFIKELGASPVTTPTTEVYMSLERGIIDGAVRNLHAINSFREYELVHYGIDFPITWSGSFAMISLRAWDSLPKDLQNVLLDSAKEVTTTNLKYFREMEDKLRKKFPEQGITFFETPQNMKNEFMEKFERAGKKGAIKMSPEYGERIVNLIHEIVSQKGGD